MPLQELACLRVLRVMKGDLRGMESTLLEGLVAQMMSFLLYLRYTSWKCM